MGKNSKSRKFVFPDYDFPVKVTRWLLARDDIQFAVNDFKRQGVACVVRRRKYDGAYSVWRECLGPQDECVLMEPWIARAQIEEASEVERYAPHSVKWSSRGVPE